MKILVTGAGGYIAYGVIKQLLADGNTVIATDVKSEIDIPDIIYFCQDIFNLDNPYEFFTRPDALLHLAWRDGFKHNSDAHINDLSKHFSFLEKMAEGGLKQVCILGSVHEIGFYEGCVDENTPSNPQSLYGISKAALREAARLIALKHEQCFQWIRGYYIVGNVTRGCSVFSKIASAERAGEKTFPFTMGKNQFDFIDYDMFCEQVASVVEQQEICGIINCCSGYPERIGERVERFIQEQHYDIKLDYGKFPDRPYDSKAIWGNNNKINSILKNKGSRKEI